MGDLKLKDNDSVLDCSLAPVLINHVSKNAFLNCEARFVLVVEKDAIFQKLVQEGFFPLFSPAVLVTVSLHIFVLGSTGLSHAMWLLF